MSESWLYFRLGYGHILDWDGYDHMLFLLALCGTYSLGDWRDVLTLVTAFTVGHSLTLALTSLEMIPANSEMVEFLIPLTILLTAIGNLARRRAEAAWQWPRYLAALGFGLVHGLGFSSYFRSLLGQGGHVLKPMLFFNLGVEAGQCLIVGAILLMAAGAFQLQLPRRWWQTGVSLSAAAVAFWLMAQRI
ncbi:MAG: hypothetical protein RLZZ165_1584 [Bacteroidota bacterium]|jgi:hypothetical protein